jgi:SAM-dependent methyltransferase
MNEFWDQRFAAEEYIYGKEPNEFFKNELIKLPIGKILLPAEGEGRNAVYAAKLGWEVYAFDSSKEGKRKAELLAKENNVKINYIITDFENVDYPLNTFDCIGLFYAHQHVSVRTIHHHKILSYLKSGGTILLEAFTKQQLGNTTGGPQDLNLLYSKDELSIDFKGLNSVNIVELEKELNEGDYHKGNAFVINVVGTK